MDSKVTPGRGVAVGAVCALTLAIVAGVFAFDRLLVAAGRADLGMFTTEAMPFIVALAGASTVGAVLTLRRPDHPVGWLFLALGGTIGLSGLLDGYGLYGTLVRPGSLPAAELAAILGDAGFVPWFVLLALVLHLTPTGSPLSPRWGWLATATVAVGILWFLTALVWPETLAPPLDHVRSPLALPAGSGPYLQVVRTVLGVLTGAGLVAAGLSLLVRLRRSHGTERRQLLWLAVAVVPLPAFVAVAFYASPDHPVLLAVATSGFIVLIPVAAGLSIARYHLYDVERILSRAVTYLLVSGVLAFTFAAVVITAGRVIGGRGESPVPAVLGTLAAVALAGPAYRAFQEAVDRRFNRRRFDALRMVRDFVRAPNPQTGVEAVLTEALGDPGLQAAYWVEDRQQWVTTAGQPVDPEPDDIEVRRHGRPVARITLGRRSVDRELAEAVAEEALPELENAGLRAAISLQLAEVRESRARIAAAQLSERRRIERNLHDGAQQRLLALALQLRAAQLNGGTDRLADAVETAIGELQGAVAELRELANGLHPAVLGDAGLGAAVDDLATRLPLPVEVHSTGSRFPPQVEATAWFIACEAITNAVKHAGAGRIDVEITAADGVLVVRVDDDGTGGADAGGRGLRGIADRAEAAGGTLTVRDRPGGGTTVTGELPCGY